MGKLRNYPLATDVLIILVAVLTLNWSTPAVSGEKGSKLKGGARLITLVEELTMSPGEIIDVGPINVSGFHFVTLLGTHDGPFEPVSGTFVFSSEEGESTDNFPRARFGCNIGGGPGGGVVFCDFDTTGRVSTLRIGGPFLAGRLTNDTVAVVSVTLKVYLSK